MVFSELNSINKLILVRRQFAFLLRQKLNYYIGYYLAERSTVATHTHRADLDPCLCKCTLSAGIPYRLPAVNVHSAGW
jgi:hypothetical protein